METMKLIRGSENGFAHGEISKVFFVVFVLMTNETLAIEIINIPF